MATPESTRSLCFQRCDFADLVHPRRPSGYSVTAFPAQNGFCTRPVALLQGSIGPRSCTSPAVFTRLRLVSRFARVGLISIHQPGSERRTWNVSRDTFNASVRHRKSTRHLFSQRRWNLSSFTSRELNGGDVYARRDPSLQKLNAIICPLLGKDVSENY